MSIRIAIKTAAVAAVAGALLLPWLRGSGPSFKPDGAVKGSSLAGWKPLGAAAWKAQDGEIVGAAQGGGGWLVLDRSFQDAGFYASFRCTGGCSTGVLLRAEKTAQGMKGIFVSLAGPEPANYRVTLDGNGRELSREPLRRAGGQIRVAPPPDPNAPAGRGGPPGRGAPPSDLPLARPANNLVPGEWNRVEILIDANIVRVFVNDGGDAWGGAAEEEYGAYGPIALYVGGSGEARFKDVAYKDLGLKEVPREQVSSNFRMQQINDFYYAWGAAAADFNRDGVTDIVAGPHYYLGPDYTKRREIFIGMAANPGLEYSFDCWMQFAGDFTGDGWPDAMTASFAPGGASPQKGPVGAWLYVNPRGEARRWDRYQVVPTFQSEVAILHDIEGDGKPELVYSAEGRVRYAKPDPSRPTAPWTVVNVSGPGYSLPHGIGAGDINGDGRADIVNGNGWWEQPPAGASRESWAYHPEAFSRYTRNIAGGSVMAVYDVNGDGRNDVVTSLSAHGWGLAWFEQKRDAGRISFVRRMIMDDYNTRNAGGVTFSQPHGATYGDVDGDGIADFIVGKRYWAHRDNYLDPDPYGPGVLYVFKTARNPKAPGGAEFVPELVHNRSGVGSDALAVDLNKDGALDIVAATKPGVFVFWGKPRSRGKR